MRRFKGIIALDIDGTITVEKHRLDEKVSSYLNYLIDQGWRLIFITGRTFSFAEPVLSDLKGDFFFAVQNGAALYEMPAKRLVKKHYLPTALLNQMPSFMLVESGKEQDDICYYCPSAFSSEELEYIQFRIQISPERWTSIDSYEDLKISEFAAGKYFANEHQVYALANRLRQLASVNVLVIRDPFNPGDYLAFVNDGQASKGLILEEFRRMHPPELPAIAAGDDFNDVDMLEKSTFRIVMQNAPETMHPLADLLAKPALEHGIVDALKEATRYYGWND